MKNAIEYVDDLKEKFGSDNKAAEINHLRAELLRIQRWPAAFKILKHLSHF